MKWFEAGYYAAAIGSHQSEVIKSTTHTEIMEKRLKIWKRYTALQNDIVGQRERKPVFFFVQPNQYLKDSKILSDEEKRTAINNRIAELNHEKMVGLKGGLQDLQNSGIPIFDLTRIFSDTRETVYKDACCHLNDRGNHIMAKEIVAVILRRQAENAPPTLKDAQTGEQ